MSGGNTSDIPQQGLVSKIAGAPPVNAGKQGKHVAGHPNNTDPSKTRWATGIDHVWEIQNAWLKGIQYGKKGQIRLWDTGKMVGENGETNIRVDLSERDGSIHGYPIP